MARDLEYLKVMDADRMLYNFRDAFGQDTKGADPLTGWEEPTGLLRGHSTGHFLSALAQAYASTGESAYKDKMDYMVSELHKLQQLSKGNPEDFETKCSPTNAAQNLWNAFWQVEPEHLQRLNKITEMSGLKLYCKMSGLHQC